MIYNRVRRKPLLRDYLSGGFLLWMHFVKHRELLRVEHTAESDVDVAMLVHGALGRDTEDKLSDFIVDMNIKYNRVFSVIDIDAEKFFQ